MPTTTTLRVEVRLGTAGNGQGDLGTRVLDHANNQSLWRLNETAGPTATDAGDFARNGTYTGTVTYSQRSAVDSGTAVLLNGSSGRIDCGDFYDFSGTAAFTVECWVKPTAIAASGFQRCVSKEITDGGGTQGWWLGIDPVTGKPMIARRLNGTSQEIKSSVGLTADGLWHHIVGTYDGATLRIYVDGVDRGNASSTQSINNHTGVLMFGARSDNSSHFDGSIDEVAIYDAAIPAATVLEHWYFGWTDITQDVVVPAGLYLRFGIDGNKPTDCLAGTGEVRFTLRNDAGNRGGVQGYYSLAHASKWEKWELGSQIRVTFVDGSTTYVRFRGRLGVADPDPGVNGPKRVRVVAYDAMRDLIATDAREVTIQIDQTAATLLTHIIDTLPVEARPYSHSISGTDAYPYAFDNAVGGVKAASLMKDIILSGLGRGYVSGEGIFVVKTRDQLATATSQYAFTDADLHHDGGLVVPTADDAVFNRVRATIHPKTIDAAATTVLYAQTGTAPAISPGATLTIWGTYRDPGDIQVMIGGTEAVTPIVATTDYTANALADGTGGDLTGNVAVTTTAFASTAKFAVTNNGSETAYLTKLQVRGKGIYDNGPRTFEAFSSQLYGDRPVTIDLPYQDDPYIGQGIASWVEAQYRSLAGQAREIVFCANSSAALMTQALTREPTEKITITEAVTGLSSVTAIITSVILEMMKGGILYCRLGLAPAAPFAPWLLGTAGASELGTTTLLGL